MTEPLVSIKMITYNHAPFIAQAIECVLNQKTNFPFELVIGEDCSTDGTREIVSEYQKKYPNIIRVITSEKNVGMKANSLRTTKAGSGKYIAFCEGDDFWHNPEKLQKQVDYMEGHPECGLVHSNFDIYYGRPEKVIKDYVGYRKWKVPENLDIFNILDDCEMGFWIRTCTAMVRRNLFDKISESDPYIHKSNHFLMGDTQIWAELSLISEIVYFPESLASYRIVEESASHSRDPRKKCRFNRSNSELKLYLCAKHKLPENFRNKMELSWYYHSLRLAFYERNVDLAEEIKKRKKTFTWAEWIRYYGAKNAFCYYVCLSVSRLRTLFSKKPIIAG